MIDISGKRLSDPYIAIGQGSYVHSSKYKLLVAKFPEVYELISEGDLDYLLLINRISSICRGNDVRPYVSYA